MVDRHGSITISHHEQFLLTSANKEVHMKASHAVICM